MAARLPRLSVLQYCFQIGVAISFTTFFYRVIRDTRTLAIIGLWNCFGTTLTLTSATIA
jgi:hypothetical protein